MSSILPFKCTRMKLSDVALALMAVLTNTTAAARDGTEVQAGQGAARGGDEAEDAKGLGLEQARETSVVEAKAQAEAR